MIHINFRDARPIYEQVKDGFCQLILSGALPPNYKLPSVRELASSLTINPNTIQRAYRSLEQEGYIVSVPGKGSFVCDGIQAAQARRRELLERFGKLVQEVEQLGITRQQLIDILQEDKKDD
jgi:GntR family transcriptional regulator